MGKAGFLFVIVLLQIFKSSPCVHAKELESLGFIRCKKHELEALLKFKQSFTKDPLNRLSSWVGDDCCQWLGVTCDNVTYNVVKLNLRSQSQYDCLPDSRVSLVSSGVSSALLELKLLTHLDLSGNDFSGSRIPEFIGSMRQLRYLNFSSCGFSGRLPPQLGNLTNLVHLDLNIFNQCTDLALHIGGVGWTSGLLKLQSLDMSGNDLSLAHDTLKVLNTLPALSALTLSRCILDNSHLSEVFLGNTSDSFFPTLQHLDLRWNGFEGPLPSVLKNMVSLRSLYLGRNHFNGSVPLGLRAMMRLEDLDLSFNGFNYVEGGIMGIMGNPCNFKHLDLSYNSISQEDILEPSMSLSRCGAFELEYLALRNNTINGSLPSLLGQFTNLNYLDLSQNDLRGSVPASFVNLSALKYLDLSINKLNGLIPDFIGQSTDIEHIDISVNSLQGTVFDIGNLSKLSYLDMNYNNLILNIDSSFNWRPPFQLRVFNVHSCVINMVFPKWLRNQTQIQLLDLSYTGISGELPGWLWNSSYLQELYLSGNQLTASLKYLDLSSNNLSGLIPDFIGQSTDIEHIDISSNSLQGTIFDIGNLSKLSYLDMNYNNLILNIDSSFNWRPPFQLQVFNVHSCVINMVFPQWLRNQTQIQDLDLSNTGISGELPGWLWNSSNLQSVLLSGNKLTGSLPQHIGDIACDKLMWLDLHNNLLTGTIPNWLSNLEYAIDLSSNRLSGAIFEGNNASSLFNIPSTLLVLDLSDNMLSGEIQFGKALDWRARLEILSLRGNHFNGPIPSQICELHSLLVLDLAHNRLTGHIPPCLGSMPFSIIAGPDISDTSLQIKEIVKGIVALSTGTEGGQSIIDLSSNNLVGTIPEELTNMSALFALNLSFNHLTGHIPENIGNLKTVESLDLSNNHLSGTIPQSLASISWISYLNLSNNNLHGPIPTGRQLQTLDDPSIYAGNSGLCGFPLPNDCTKPSLPPSLTNVNPGAGKDEVENEDKYEKLWFILAVMSGVATGFWGVVVTLVIKRSWRESYFRYVEDVADRIYVPIKVRVNRFKMRFDENS